MTFLQASFRFVFAICFAPVLAVAQSSPDDLPAPADRVFYQPSTWQPRLSLPADDSLRGDFWPKSPEVHITYDDPGFAADRLSPAPAPGIYPRVLITPSDLEVIRAKVALGDKAPKAFQVMWARVSATKSAFYALVVKDNALGQSLANQLVEKMHTLEPKLADMDARLDHDNYWSVDRSIIASGSPNPPTEIMDLLDYDYLHDWLKPEDQALAMKLVTHICAHRISNFMTEPDHFLINNHQGFGLEYLRLMLLAEGQPGFDKEVYARAMQKAKAMLSWYLDDDGMCYESIKGWLNVSAFIAAAHRDPEFIKHDHLRAKMRFFQAAIRWEDGQWHIRDEMRASAFHVIWMMHYFHPQDRGIDMLYQATFTTHDFLNDPTAKWPGPVGIAPELLCLFANDPMLGPDGKPINWTDQANIDSLNLPLTWHDDLRGYVDTRNTWRKDDLHLGFVCKQDFYYGGHEGSEDNRITLWKDGVNWIQDLNMLAVKATWLQNMISVDGKGCHWPPAPGTWLGTQESKSGLVASGDGKDGFSFSKVMQVHPLDFPSLKLGYYAPFAEGNYDFTRNQQVAYNPRTVKFTDGYSHTDYGEWSGEDRLVEDYRDWNPMEQAYRTVHLARGKHPYVLVFDDAQKDGLAHQFSWNISVPPDSILVDAVTPEIVFQSTDPNDSRQDDLVLGKSGMPIDPKTGKATPRAGDPLCLIRVLWRNTDYGFDVPRLEHFHDYAHVTIPAHSISPEFRILVYPFKEGEPLPKTSWNADQTQLTVGFEENGKSSNTPDVYQLRATDGGRTVLSMDNQISVVFTDGAWVTTRTLLSPLLRSNAPPARPVMIVRGDRFDQNDLRYTRIENEVPEYKVNGLDQVSLALENAPANLSAVPAAGQPNFSPNLLMSPQGHIHYTTDGTDPTEASPIYNGASILINQDCTLKARVIDPNWPCGPTSSQVLAAKFTVTKPDPGLGNFPGDAQPGVLARVYEEKTVLYDNKGFFRAYRTMMPDVSIDQPITASVMDSFSLPYTQPTRPQIEQRKGFYRFSGWFLASQGGVYQFAVDSCGPVTFDIGNQTAIEETGVFHQQQKVRKGDVVLDPGWHKFNLVVCDPLFWNLNSVDPMPFSVNYRINGGAIQSIARDDLRCSPPKGLTLSGPPQITSHEASKNLPILEQGVDFAAYDRTDLRHTPDLLEIDKDQPYHTERVMEFQDNANRNAVFVYTGYFYAPTTGIYAFDLAAHKGTGSVLGSLPSMCQNQLRVDDDVVVQRGVPGRMPLRQVKLEEGWHAVSVRFGPSLASGTVTYPNGQSVPLTAELLSRATQVCFLVNGKPAQSLNELYEPGQVVLNLPESLPKSDANGATIHFTLDGGVPSANSPAYTEPLQIDKDQQVTAMAFASDGHVLTGISSVTFNRVTSPQSGRLGTIRFDNWNGLSGDFSGTSKDLGVWIGQDSALGNGRTGKSLDAFPALNTMAPSANGVDVNVSHLNPRAAIKLHHIHMREDALTVAIWFKTNALSGPVFGKDGYNAFGKSYKTFSCALNKGRFTCSPGHVDGGEIKAGEWNQVLLTASINEMSLYLNGKWVATGPGTPNLTTDALDLFLSHSAEIDEVDVFDRLLNANEVNHLYNSTSKATK